MTWCFSHRWIVVDPLVSELPNDHFSVTWTEMVCAKCLKVKLNNTIRLRDTLVLPLVDWIDQ